MPLILPSRRDIIRTAALCGLASTAPLKLARGAPIFQNDPFQLGVASGDAVVDGFVIWTRIAPDPFNPDVSPESFEVAWEVATDGAMKRIVKRGKALARPDMAHSIHVDVRGLAPYREYFYRFHCGHAFSRVGRALTMPKPMQSVDRLRFAYASCAHFEQGYFSAYRDMVAQDPAFMVHLGDYIYEFAWKAPVRNHPSREARTLAEYRAYHAAYKMDPDLQNAHAYCPWFVTWDDHEVVNDYSKAESHYDPDPAAFLQRKLAAYKAYYEHMPLRASAAFTGTGMALYQRFLYGNLAEFNVTDGRQYRDAIACPAPGSKLGRIADAATCDGLQDESRTMLGMDQERWLQDGFAKAGARWNVMANGQMFAAFDQTPGPVYGVFTETWGGFPAARRRMLDVIKQRGAQNVVAIAGDIHSFFVSDVKDDDRDPASATLMSEFVGTSVTSDSTKNAVFAAAMPENPHIKFFEDRQRGYVLCDITPGAWQTHLRVVDDVRIPNGVFSTLKSFAVENGKPGVQSA
jgi:alkaline phosphatase D